MSTNTLASSYTLVSDDDIGNAPPAASGAPSTSNNVQFIQWHPDSASEYEPSPPTEPEPEAPPVKRKRGRPPNKEKVFTVKRRPGRPKKYIPPWIQVEPKPKRPVGRPPKKPLPPGCALSNRLEGPTQDEGTQYSPEDFALPRSTLFETNQHNYSSGSLSSSESEDVPLRLTARRPITMPNALTGSPGPVEEDVSMSESEPASSTSSWGTQLLAGVIPLEDAERMLDVYDEEPLDGAHPREMEMGEDNENDTDGEDDSPSEEEAGSRSRPELPAWLMDAFNARLNEFETQRDEKGIPLLYSQHKSFWFPTQSPYLTMASGSYKPIYDARFFVWDPEVLYKDIPCPICRCKLVRHSSLNRPRRCVDFQSTFYLIGYRYHCTQCVNQRTNKRTVTFRSWDSRILDVLPEALAAEFPARLTHRSGLSKALVCWLRACTADGGMSRKHFADAIHQQHVRHHEELQQQYLNFVAAGLAHTPVAPPVALQDLTETQSNMLLADLPPSPPGPSSQLLGMQSGNKGKKPVRGHKRRPARRQRTRSPSLSHEIPSSPELYRISPRSTSTASLDSQAAAPPAPTGVPSSPIIDRGTFGQHGATLSPNGGDSNAQPPVPEAVNVQSSYTSTSNLPVAAPQLPAALNLSYGPPVPPFWAQTPWPWAWPYPTTSSTASILPHAYPATGTAMDGSSTASATGQPAQESVTRRSGVALPLQRHGRTCMKCGSQLCDGKTKRESCFYPCRDCGKVDCYGRDSVYPDKPCWTVDHEKIRHRKERLRARKGAK